MLIKNNRIVIKDRSILQNILLAMRSLTACSITASVVAPAALAAPAAPAPSVMLPEVIPDPLEPINRGLWQANKALLTSVVDPSSRAYRTVVPQPVRESVRNVTRNICYPGRLANHLLQGRWQGAKDESVRFLTNTTVGIGGIFDVASQWKQPKSDADFSQTFGTWGWHPRAFVMLPVLGPSDDRHAIGLAADKAAEPWTFAYPCLPASVTSTFNQMSDHTDDAIRLVRMEADSYSLVKSAWTYSTKDHAADLTSSGPVDLPTLQSFAAASTKCQSPKFANSGRDMSVRIPTTGRKLEFTYWLPNSPTAPLVYLVPGLGSHRLSMVSLALAESLQAQGYAVVSTTSVFHPEFMEAASTAALPGYIPVESRDLLVSLTQMDQALAKKYPSRFTSRSLVGISMGGFLAIRLAAFEPTAEPGLLQFDRYVAVDPPVDLNHCENTLDSYTMAPMAWPAAERQARINNTVHRAATTGVLSGDAPAAPPLSGIESKYLISLIYRISLRDMIFSSQQRRNLGVLQTPISNYRREPAYREIMSYSYHDYFRDFTVPYYHSLGISSEQIERSRNLRFCESLIHKQLKLYVIENENDFLTTKTDLAWLKSTIGTARLATFPQGGHLGNLNSPAVHNAIFKALPK